MSKCIKCGSPLPPVGECPHCSEEPTTVLPTSVLANLLERDLSFDDERTRPGGPPPLPETPPPLPREAAPKPVSKPAITEIKAQPASLWRRAFAFIVDFCVVGLVASLYLLAATAIAGKGSSHELSGLDGVVSELHAISRILLPGAVLIAILAMSYAGAFGFLWDGCTLGRKLFGIRLVDQSGLAPTPTRAIVRALLSALSFGLFFAGFWLALFDRQGQALHDKLTSTFVVQPG